MKNTTIITGEDVNGMQLMVAKSAGKLEKLNELQIYEMHKTRQFWLDYIFSCKKSLIKQDAIKGIEWLYRLAGYEKPIIVFLDSPMACQIGANILKQSFLNTAQVWDQVGAQVWDQVGDQVGDQVRDQVRAQVWAQVWDQVWDQVGDQVGAQVWAQVWDQVGDQVRDQVGAQVWAQVGDQVGDQVRDQVRAQVWAQVWDQVWDQVGDQVRAQVWDQVGDQVGDQVRAQVRDQVGDQVWDQVGDQVGDQVRAQVWAQKMENFSFSGYGSISDWGWVSFYDFFKTIGILNHKSFEEFKSLLLSGIYDMIQLNGFCIVSTLPKKIIRNSSGRLHNSNGPAIEFADGYCQYYINGRALPEWIWEKADKGEITKEMFLNERNSDIKGGIYEVLGQKKMLDLLGAKEIDERQIIHKNGDIETVTLLKTEEVFEEIDNKPFAWVKMVCPSTGTQYLQGVEPHHTNALDAIASLSMFKSKDYSFTHRS